MKVKLTTRDQSHIITLATFDSMTEQAQFQQFLSRFKVNGWYQVNDTVAISFDSCERFEILKG